MVNREADLKAMNMKALQIAREVADETGTLMAGNICNTTVYKRDDEDAINKARNMFKVKVANYCIGNLLKTVETQAHSINFVSGGGQTP